MAKVKVVYTQLIKMRWALEELDKRNLPIPYEIAKNLNRIINALTEPTMLIKKAAYKYIDRDGSGQPDLWGINKSGDVALFDKNNAGDFAPNAKLSTKISDPQKYTEYEKQKKAVENDSFEVDFHEVNILKIKDYLENNSGLGIYLEPLIGKIIVETEQF